MQVLGETAHRVGPFASDRFRYDRDLIRVAGGTLRLGRPSDPNWPAPILSKGAAVARVQQALVDLGHALPRGGVDARFGPETYGAVLAYKTRHNIRTPTGVLDGIVGPRTISHLDRAVVGRPLPACALPAQTAELTYENGGGPVPYYERGWLPCGADWKIAWLQAGFLLPPAMAHRSRNHTCQLQVGRPTRLHTGRLITDADATFRVRAAIQAASRGTNEWRLRQDPWASPDFLLCATFKRLLLTQLQSRLPGARLYPFGHGCR